MVDTLWWGVMGSLIFSIACVLLCRYYFRKGNVLADARLDRFVEVVETLQKEAMEVEEEEFEVNKFIEVNGPMLDAVCDHFIDRINTKDTNIARGMQPKTAENKMKWAWMDRLKEKDGMVGMAMDFLDGQTG